MRKSNIQPDTDESPNKIYHKKRKKQLKKKKEKTKERSTTSLQCLLPSRLTISNTRAIFAYHSFFIIYLFISGYMYEM